MSLADGWGHYGVTVNCLAPGAPNSMRLYTRTPPGWNTLPQRPADDLDAALVFLAAKSSRYVRGQTLLVDGGISTDATRALLDSTMHDKTPSASR
jgi:gluconate 5-dehydrogenase